jgi:hypothetical protein
VHRSYTPMVKTIELLSSTVATFKTWSGRVPQTDHHG